MKNQIRQFHSKEFGSLEILMIDGKPYFPATECAKTLGYKDPFDAIKRRTKGSVKHRALTSGGEQEIKFIPEGDLYRLIIRSKLPAAERFEKWVFDEVLPSIRRHGIYATSETLDGMLRSQAFADTLLQMLADERLKNTALEEIAVELAPKARYCDLILQSESAIPVSLIAKDYGITAAAFNRLLHRLGIQYKISGTWLLYQKYAGESYTQTRTYISAEQSQLCTPAGRRKGGCSFMRRSEAAASCRYPKSARQRINGRV